MPASVSLNNPGITWLQYLQKHSLPACPYKPVDKLDLSASLERTHEPSGTVSALCGADSTLNRTSNILDRSMEELVETWLQSNTGIIIPDDDYVQPLLNEQAVAEMYFKAVLAPVQQALTVTLASIMGTKHLEKGRYFFNIRPQQGSSAKNDHTRCDHYLVLEHRDGITEEDQAPRKTIRWRDPTTFATMFRDRVQWESNTSSNKGQAPEYPCLVLCVIEEKKPNVIREEDFVHDYVKQALAGNAGAANVKRFLPPLKKYSVNAECKFAILTDYNNTLLLYVEEAGARFNASGDIEKTGDKPKVQVKEGNQPARWTLFAVAIRRLMDARLIDFKKSRTLNSSTPPKVTMHYCFPLD